MRGGLINMGIGLFVLAAGVGYTLVTMAAANRSGGYYFIAGGAIVVGGLQFIRGFVQFLRGLFTKEGRATLQKVFWPQSAFGTVVRLTFLAAVAAVFWIVAPESWKTISPASLRSFPLDGEANSIAYTPDGKWIAVAMGYGGLKILSASSGAEGKMPALESSQEIEAVALPPDGRLLAARREDLGDAVTVSRMGSWMTPSARMAAAIEIMGDIGARRRPASDALKDWGLAHRFAGSQDRAALEELTYDALRCRASAAWIMGDETPRASIFDLFLSGAFGGAKRRKIVMRVAGSERLAHEFLFCL